MAPFEQGHWRQIEELYHAALKYEPAERPGFLQKACAGDDALCRELESLLANDEEGESLLTAKSLAGDLAAEILAKEEATGSVLGPYHLVQLIGEGGMGEVWLAEQKEPVRRRVAVKLVKAGMNTREVIGRFDLERQALALMDHATIAKVFDAGSTPQGTPYFVMEHVAGLPITTYCDSHRLRTHERLELFMHVCEGVQHAHQKAIIHRDLKPSNILVTEVDGRAAPKIIDFGVAKALTQKLTAHTLLTRMGAMIGTPQYMSPEQALSSGEDIDTRTDVYSLGVILYELLAGAPPLDMREIPLDEFLRRLRDDEPPTPSTRIRTHHPVTVSELAHRRQTEPLALVRQMRGDLDAIVLKALEKDRSRRYGSPAELAADIGRYLKYEAVLAIAPSGAYRARKFARRYRAALATTAAFVLVLLVAAGISIRQTIRANREAAVSQAVNDFLQKDLLAQASAATQSGPDAKPDPHLEVRTAVDRAAARIAGKFDRQPDLEAAIRDTIGQTYYDLGLYPEAQTQLERALELHRRAVGAENPRTLNTLMLLGNAAEKRGRFPEAESLLLQTVAIQRRVLGSEHRDTLASMGNLAVVYYRLGKYAQAETLQSQTLEVLRRVLGPEHPVTLASMNNLANVYMEEGKYAQAEALYSQTLEIRRRVSGPEHPDTLSVMNNLSLNSRSQGKYAQAEALYSQTLEIMRRVLGPEHLSTLAATGNLAEVYWCDGKYAQSEALYSQAVETGRRVLGPEHPFTLMHMDGLAGDYLEQGKYAQAEAMLNKTLEASRRVLGPEHNYTLIFLTDLTSLYQRQGNYAMAQDYAALALAGRRKTFGSDHPLTMTSAADLALAYLSHGKFGESEPLAREALDFGRKKQPDDWKRFRAESLLGASLAGQKQYAEAEPFLLEGYQGMAARKDQIAVPDRYHLYRAREWILQMYQAWGKPEKAAEWRKR
jgi:serine/threonine protein kinase/tetratricopeptide (TPR) repeat protein